ncbi:MAG: hypothetical protein DRP24_00320 [Thermotoga sp.]|nr:MAG: hypothetical protein DRP24_00320 [Thermotoga sp.]
MILTFHPVLKRLWMFALFDSAKEKLYNFLEGPPWGLVKIDLSSPLRGFPRFFQKKMKFGILLFGSLTRRYLSL